MLVSIDWMNYSLWSDKDEFINIYRTDFHLNCCASPCRSLQHLKSGLSSPLAHPHDHSIVTWHGRYKGCYAMLWTHGTHESLKVSHVLGEFPTSCYREWWHRLSHRRWGHIKPIKQPKECQMTIKHMLKRIRSNTWLAFCVAHCQQRENPAVLQTLSLV